MVDVASGSAVKMYYVEEDGNGDIPATTPAFSACRFNTEALDREVTQVPTNEINPSRQRGLDRQGTYSVSGNIVAEAAYGAHDDLIEAALQGTWATDVLKVGSTMRTFALLKHHTDIDEWFVHRNCRLATWGIGAALNSRALFTFDFLGLEKESFTPPGDETYPAVTTTESMVTVQGSLIENSVAIAYATNIDITLTNNMEALFALFSRPAYSVQNGIFVASGALNAYMPDTTLYAKYLAETITDLQLTITENSQSYEIDLPSVALINGASPTGGQGAITPAYNFSAGYDGTAQSTVVVTRTP